MSQEVQVLQCYSCHSYQTQIVKKTNKWVCKLCNEKQTVKKVLGQGSGKDCREHCQRLNDLRQTKENNEKNISLSLYELETPPIQSKEQGGKNMSSQSGGSRWNKYLSQAYTSEVDEEEQNDICPSQFYIPKSTPVSIDIPLSGNSKSGSGQIVSNCNDFFMDSDDSLFADIPQDSSVFGKDVDEEGGDTVTIVATKEGIELPHSESVERNVSIQAIQRNVRNTEQLRNSNAKSFKITRIEMSGADQLDNNALFKMVPSDNFDIEHFKKSISLFEDIDSYTADELTEMCKL